MSMICTTEPQEDKMQGFTRYENAPSVYIPKISVARLIFKP